MDYSAIEQLDDRLSLIQLSARGRSFWSGNTIEEGISCVLVEHDNRYLLCSIDDVEPLVTRMMVVDEESGAVGPTGSLEVIDAGRQITHSCLWCDEGIGQSAGILLFQPASEATIPAQLALHYGCRQAFIESLKGLWDYSSTILSEHL